MNPKRMISTSKMESEDGGEDDEVLELPEAPAHDVSEPPKPATLAAPWSYYNSKLHSPASNLIGMLCAHVNSVWVQQHSEEMPLESVSKPAPAKKRSLTWHLDC